MNRMLNVVPSSGNKNLLCTDVSQAHYNLNISQFSHITVQKRQFSSPFITIPLALIKTGIKTKAKQSKAMPVLPF